MFILLDSFHFAFFGHQSSTLTVPIFLDYIGKLGNREIFSKLSQFQHQVLPKSGSVKLKKDRVGPPHSFHLAFFGHQSSTQTVPIFLGYREIGKSGNWEIFPSFPNSSTRFFQNRDWESLGKIGLDPPRSVWVLLKKLSKTNFKAF